MVDIDVTAHAHLFMVRVWSEDLGEGKAEWRGKVQCVPSGEAFYFRDWQGMVALLQNWLALAKPDSARLEP